MLINTIAYIDFPRPQPFAIHYLSTTIIDTSTARLDDDWQTIVDRRPDGVIVISFGTIARSTEMPPSLKVHMRTMYVCVIAF